MFLASKRGLSAAQLDAFQAATANVQQDGHATGARVNNRQVRAPRCWPSAGCWALSCPPRRRPALLQAVPCLCCPAANAAHAAHAACPPASPAGDARQRPHHLRVQGLNGHIAAPRRTCCTHRRHSAGERAAPAGARPLFPACGACPVRGGLCCSQPGAWWRALRPSATTLPSGLTPLPFAQHSPPMPLRIPFSRPRPSSLSLSHSFSCRAPHAVIIPSSPLESPPWPPRGAAHCTRCRPTCTTPATAACGRRGGGTRDQRERAGPRGGRNPGHGMRPLGAPSLLKAIGDWVLPVAQTPCQLAPFWLQFHGASACAAGGGGVRPPMSGHEAACQAGPAAPPRPAPLACSRWRLTRAASGWKWVGKQARAQGASSASSRRERMAAGAAWVGVGGVDGGGSGAGGAAGAFHEPRGGRHASMAVRGGLLCVQAPKATARPLWVAGTHEAAVRRARGQGALVGVSAAGACPPSQHRRPPPAGAAPAAAAGVAPAAIASARHWRGPGGCAGEGTRLLWHKDRCHPPAASRSISGALLPQPLLARCRHSSACTEGRTGLPGGAVGWPLRRVHRFCLWGAGAGSHRGSSVGSVQDETLAGAPQPPTSHLPHPPQVCLCQVPAQALWVREGRGVRGAAHASGPTNGCCGKWCLVGAPAASLLPCPPAGARWVTGGAGRYRGAGTQGAVLRGSRGRGQRPRRQPHQAAADKGRGGQRRGRRWPGWHAFMQGLLPSKGSAGGVPVAGWAARRAAVRPAARRRHGE